MLLDSFVQLCVCALFLVLLNDLVDFVRSNWSLILVDTLVLFRFFFRGN